MTSYTPGPWKVTGAYISAPSWEGFCKIYRQEDGSTAEESEANARLIAHAPELVEALEAAAAIVHDSHTGPIERAHCEVAFCYTVEKLLRAVRGTE